MASEETDVWNDHEAHREWIELRQNQRDTVFPIGPDVASDTVDRLHRIIREGTDLDAIKAAGILAKLSSTTTARIVAQSTVLRNHAKVVPPVQKEDEFTRKLMDEIMNPRTEE